MVRGYRYYGGWTFDWDDIFDWFMQSQMQGYPQRCAKVMPDLDQFKDAWENLPDQIGLINHYFRLYFNQMFKAVCLIPITFSDARGTQLGFFILEDLRVDDKFYYDRTTDPRLEAKVSKYEKGLTKIGLPVHKQGGFQTYLEGRGGVQRLR